MSPLSLVSCRLPIFYFYQSVMSTTATLLLRLPIPSALRPAKPPTIAAATSSSSSALTLIITCGPRDNRGPLVRGRTLSTEAILAVQSLKRSRGDPSALSRLLSSSLPRLLKPDLLAALAELLRQDHPLLAIRLLPLLRSDPTYSSPNLSLYADIVACLARTNNLENYTHHHHHQLMQEVVAELERDGGIKGEDLRGPARLIKSLVAAGRAEDARVVYGLMKRGGCVPNEYLFKFLVRGLRRLGDEEGAKEVERDYEEWDARGAWGEGETEAESGTVPVR